MPTTAPTRLARRQFQLIKARFLLNASCTIGIIIRAMRIKYSLLVALLLSLIFPASRAMAWGESGHRETAAIAWEDLTPVARAKIVEILKQHPRYEQDLLANIPRDYAGEEVPRYAFTSAAVWPDTVRGINNPMHATHNHPAWHYIDIPYAIGAASLCRMKSREGMRRAWRIFSRRWRRASRI